MGLLCGAGTLAPPALRAADAPPTFVAPPPADYVSRSWNTDQGLPHNVVTRIQQDHAGYLWLATLAGLTRFDGREFKVFPVPATTSGGGRNIRDLGVTEDGRVLFIPASGGVWQLRNGAIEPHPASRAVEGKVLLELFIAPGGVIWIETSTELVRWENGEVQRFGRNEGINRRMLHFSWAVDRSGRTWIGGASFLGYLQNGKLVQTRDTANAVYRVAPARAGGVWVFGEKLYRCDDEELVPVAEAPWPAGRASARCLYEDRTGVLWVASSREGVFCYDGKQFQSLPDVESGVEFVTEDREGNVWLATDGGGIRRVRTKAFTLIESPVSSISEDDTGALWFAAQSAGVVRRFGTTRETIGFRFGRSPLTVSNACVDKAGNLWLAAAVGIFQTTVKEPRALRRVDAGIRNTRILLAASNGDVWVGGGTLLGYFHEGAFTSLPDVIPAGQEITALVEQPAGHFWIGTSKGQLFEITAAKAARSPIALGIGDGTIHAILPQSSGVLWLATTEGLLHVDGAEVRRFTSADGLPDDIVLQLLEGTSGDLWLSTPRGIFRLAKSDLDDALANRNRVGRLSPIAYGPEQGLFGISPATNYQPAARRDAKGDLWFCTYKGVLGIHPARLQHDATPPPVLIDRVNIDDHAVREMSDVRVPAGEHRIEFRFAALSFAAPERVQLRHQLEGFDSEWVDTAPDRTARYAKLPPGRYRMRVIACNSEGIWNREGASLAFTVLPSWWQTSWFRTAAVLAFAGLVAGGARFWSQRILKAQLERLERENALAKERARIARDMHDELGGSVTGINLVVQRLRDEHGEQPDGLIEVLDRRVRRLTVELERVVWTVSPKNSSLDQLAVFVERFAHNLFTDSPIHCRVLGRDRIPARPLNPECQHHVLAVTKEAINNVLKHSRATEATIEMGYEHDVFRLAVRDNGVGFSPEAQAHSERNGLRNMHSRVAEVNGTLTIESAPGQGSAVILQLPLSAHPSVPCPSPSQS